LVILLFVCAAGTLCSPAAQNQSIQDHYRSAQQALAEKQYEIAAREFRKILQLNPKVAEAHANLGSIHYLRGEYSQASDEFRKALELKPALPKAAMFLGMSEVKRGRTREGQPHLEKGFWKAAEDDEWRLEAGLMLVEIHHGALEADKALDVVRALQRSYPASQDVLYAAYRLHSEMASRAIATMVKSAPESARLHQLTAELLESEGNHPRAIEEYRKALEIDPHLAGAHRALGVALMNNAPDEAARAEAKQHFERELALNPIDAHSEYQLGEIHWRENRPDEARKHFARAVDLYPNFTDALIAMGKMSTARGEPEKAVEYLKRALKVDPENEVVHYRLAQAYQRMGDSRQSAQAMEEFRRLRAAAASIRTIYKQLDGSRITAQTAEGER
jgi:tetratricopeptide (TPR) repeat protein